MLAAPGAVSRTARLCCPTDGNVAPRWEWPKAKHAKEGSRDDQLGRGGQAVQRESKPGHLLVSKGRSGCGTPCHRVWWAWVAVRGSWAGPWRITLPHIQQQGALAGEQLASPCLWAPQVGQLAGRPSWEAECGALAGRIQQQLRSSGGVWPLPAPSHGACQAAPPPPSCAILDAPARGERGPGGCGRPARTPAPLCVGATVGEGWTPLLLFSPMLSFPTIPPVATRGCTGPAFNSATERTAWGAETGSRASWVAFLVHWGRRSWGGGDDDSAVLAALCGAGQG